MKNINYKNKPLLIITLASLLIIGMTGCKKFVEVNSPGNSTNASNVYTTDATAAAVLTGIYTKLSSGNASSFTTGTGDLTSISLFAALSADELNLFDPTNQRNFLYYSNSLTANSYISTADFWSTIYPYIFTANSAIEGLTNTTSLTPAVKQQLLGEAKFIRAFCYFYLVNLFGDVPMALTSDWQINAKISRTPASQVYQQMISDLKDAEDLLSAGYLNSDALTVTTARVRPNKWAAAALLARVYLYAGNHYAEAEVQASKLINNTSFQLVPLNNVFLKNSNEAIWQLQSVGTGLNSNTAEGMTFILPATGPSSSYPFYLSNYLLNSFETGDQRKTNWVNTVTPTPPGTTTYYYPYKYKISAVNTSAQEYCTIFRLAEQYLIRAEAEVQQNKLPQAIADLDNVRKRAGLPLISVTNPGISQTALLDKILHERQVELFTEWGHRWLDLKRTNKVDVTMSTITTAKGGAWKSGYQLYPIPQTELNKAPQLTQNRDY